MHRFIPLYAYLAGRAHHRDAGHATTRASRGTSKYGLGRTFKVLLDLITVKFLSDYSTKPIYVFGGSRVVPLLLGACSSALHGATQKLVQRRLRLPTPLPLLAVFLFLLGVSFILMGLLAELIMRTYHESQAKPIYRVREPTNVEARGPAARSGDIACAASAGIVAPGRRSTRRCSRG